MEQPRRKFKLMLGIGFLMTIVPPATLAIMFGNNEVPNDIAFLMPILGGLIPLSGIILVFRYAILLKPEAFQIKSSTILAVTGQQPHTAWTGWFFAATLFIASAVVQWQNISFIIDRPIRWFPFLVIAVFATAFVITKLLNQKKSIITLLIGDLGLDPKDEREAAIFQRAGRAALATSFVIINLLFIILLITPRPTDIALLDLFIAVVMIQRGFCGFFAWRMGLK